MNGPPLAPVSPNGNNAFPDTYGQQELALHNEQQQPNTPEQQQLASTILDQVTHSNDDPLNDAKAVSLYLQTLTLLRDGTENGENVHAAQVLATV